MEKTKNSELIKTKFKELKERFERNETDCMLLLASTNLTGRPGSNCKAFKTLTSETFLNDITTLVNYSQTVLERRDFLRLLEQIKFFAIFRIKDELAKVEEKE